jgi:hypothetical protein
VPPKRRQLLTSVDRIGRQKRASNRDRASGRRPLPRRANNARDALAQRIASVDVKRIAKGGITHRPIDQNLVPGTRSGCPQTFADCNFLEACWFSFPPALTDLRTGSLMRHILVDKRNRHTSLAYR